MRQIKFRAWDKLNKKMYFNPWNGKIGGINNIFSNPGDWGYLQFTGLTDKNGKEIYEGDIVQQFSDDDPYFRYVVKFEKGAFGYQPHGEDYDFISYAGNPHFKWNKEQSDKIEILGNIYENPELLSKEDALTIVSV